MANASVKLYRTADGLLVEIDRRYYQIPNVTWDTLFNDSDLHERLSQAGQAAREVAPPSFDRLLPPIGRQEVWAAGVTYLRSKTARQAESAETGGGDFYDRVYDAVRPELFFKAAPHRVVGPGQPIRIRRDSEWSVPEPELALAVDSAGRIIGYSIGNDVSARDIEGENPLYLPLDDDSVRHEAVATGAGPVPRSRQQLSGWLLPADGNRHRATGVVLATPRRQSPDHDRRDRDA